jgi:hypothetical protein
VRAALTAWLELRIPAPVTHEPGCQVDGSQHHNREQQGRVWRARAVGQVGPADDVLDPVEQRRARRLEQPSSSSVWNWRTERLPPLAGRQSVSESQPGMPDRLSKASTWELLAAIINSRSSRASARTGATLGSMSAFNILQSTVLAEPCSPETTRSG